MVKHIGVAPAKTASDNQQYADYHQKLEFEFLHENFLSYEKFLKI